VYFWSKTAETDWVRRREDILQAHAHGRLVIVHRPGHKRLQLEISLSSRKGALTLLQEFGGRIERLPPNWLERFALADSKSVKIGKRLIVSIRGSSAVAQGSGPESRSHIIIPASLAFGTGEHATTAMSLRFLEQLTRLWNPGWSLGDLGTGSGILALAAKCFGARRVVGIDNDPAAVLTAKSNARSNRIRGANFRLCDVRKWKPAHKIDVITANLYSGLLVEILPNLGNTTWLILSGILCREQSELARALPRNYFEIFSVKRRGKWIAILARSTGALRRSDPQPANFCGDQRPPLQ
jgi:ribosomal protein L11 methyltransferase